MGQERAGRGSSRSPRSRGPSASRGTMKASSVAVVARDHQEVAGPIAQRHEALARRRARSRRPSARPWCAAAAWRRRAGSGSTSASDAAWNFSPQNAAGSAACCSSVPWSTIAFAKPTASPRRARARRRRAPALRARSRWSPASAASPPPPNASGICVLTSVPSSQTWSRKSSGISTPRRHSRQGADAFGREVAHASRTSSCSSLIPNEITWFLLQRRSLPFTARGRRRASVARKVKVKDRPSFGVCAREIWWK